MIKITINATIAAGRAIQKFALNLSFILHPCPEVAATVVSEMNERLSPNIAPPITVATQKGRLSPEIAEMFTAIGVRTAIVPQEVPIAIEMKHATAKITAAANSTGMMSSMKYDTAAALDCPTVPVNTPANRKINSIIMMFLSPTPFAMMPIFLSSESFLFWQQATMIATRKAPTTGIL